MIYLIGGSPRCGKTILSKSLQEKHNIPCIHLDNITWTYFNSLTKEEQKKLFPLYFSDNGDEERFDRYSIKENIEIEIKEGQNISHIILNIIKYNTFGYKDYIIEGIQLTPNLVDYIKKNITDNVFKNIFLVNTCATSILEGIKKYINSGGDCWLKGLSEDHLKLYSSFISHYSMEIISQGNKYNFQTKICDIKNDFNFKISSILKSDLDC